MTPMLDPNAHLSDRDLIMALDGELSGRRKAQVGTHLDACWSCRERMSTIETTIAEFVRARNRQLSDPAPAAAGPRALFRARLAESASAAPCRRWWRLAPAAAAFLSVAAATLIIFEATVSAEGPKPKARLTPGETRPITLDQVCRSSKAEVVSSGIPPETRRAVFASYGIRPARVDEFEIDYLITPDLGGAASIRNLWPQPYSARWNARVKDELEQRLHDLVCDGRLDLRTAQRDLATDWIGAYKKYFGVSAPQ
jgi:hypothetical protein